ncbi:MAG: GIY-YIG nuclease family protein [Candidatus Peribacteraceae bacterium]|nr:GIY-YIG nuclease family protein [Candidatus Peribacteraceae bacterium]MDD5742739.1 GIY-YIG nuclease family protein [Candidatus Peribacteraceae bacterium]
MPKKKNPKEAELKKRVAKLPTKPGVYRWLDAKGVVLYVGKALNLRKRVTSYLNKEAPLGPWKQSLMEKAADVSVTVTNSELEALILETNLIKQKKPKYNVLMKDDKNYVYVRISVQDSFPRIELVRKPAEDQAKYFGPYVSALEIRDTLTLLRRVFPYRTCKMSIEVASSPTPFPSPGGGGVKPVGNALPPLGEGVGMGVTIKNRDRPTPCLDYHIKQCSGPCIGCVTPEEYRHVSVEGVINFLKGNTEAALALLSQRMQDVARERKFEQAAKLRDALRTIERLSEKQIISDTSGEDADIFGVAVESGRVHVTLLKERNGKVIDESSFTLLGHAENAAEALAQFLPQYYVDAPDVPPLLLLPEETPEQHLLQAWLSERRALLLYSGHPERPAGERSRMGGSKVVIRVPERGKGGKLLALAEENAREKVQHFETSWEAAARNVSDALKALKEVLALPAIPKRIEGYDISHLSGTETVGSMSVFVDGKPKNDQYRSFTIRTMREGDVDDYRALSEVLKRRLLHLKMDTREEEKQWKKKGITFGRARKNEMKMIQTIIRKEKLPPDDLRTKDFIVARDGKTIVGFARIYSYKDGTKMLKSLWVQNRLRGARLGQFLCRRLLGREKKGRIYLLTSSTLEEYYGEMGFRYIREGPKLIEHMSAKLPAKGRHIRMMYDVKDHRSDLSLSARPDLLLIDGGKGQLGAAGNILRELNQEIPVISLAKREEDVFASGSQKPIEFAKDSPARFLLMRLRDEAHRFANAHRETRAKKRAVFSVLDSVPGIGPQTRVKLLKKFGSLDVIRKTDDAELLKILSQSQLKTFREQL